MDCPLLSHSPLKPCKSTSNLFAHTLFSSDMYCKGIWFPLCPRFRQEQFHNPVCQCISSRSYSQEVDPAGKVLGAGR
jgi:hypothetical protein